MSTKTSSDRPSTTTSNKHATSINIGIDSTFTCDPSHRGSLTPNELDSIHQTSSFKQAAQLQDEDNSELDAKMKKLQHNKTKKQLIYKHQSIDFQNKYVVMFSFLIYYAIVYVLTRIKICQIR